MKKKTTKKTATKPPISKENVNNDDFQDISSNILKFTDAGEFFIGELDGFMKVETDQGECTAYSFNLHNTNIEGYESGGRISIIGGYQVDDAIHKQGIVNGDVMRIEFLGKIETTGGKTMNRYKLGLKRVNSSQPQ